MNACAGFWVTSDGDLCRNNATGICPVVRERYSYHCREITTGAQLRATLRAGPYAWPGGYALYFVADDGEALSFAAVRENLEQITRAIRDKHNSGWRVVACQSTEGDEEPTYCAHTGEEIK